MPAPLYPPLGPLGIGWRFNATLHGRSRYRAADVPGHNVFHGYARPGWGDALDLFCPAGTPVFAGEECRQVQHRCDDTLREVIYLQGADFLVVMAHLEAARDGTGHRYRRGAVVGHVRAGLKDPHLHLEVARRRAREWEPLVARHADEYAALLRALVLPPPARRSAERSLR